MDTEERVSDVLRWNIQIKNKSKSRFKEDDGKINNFTYNGSSSRSQPSRGFIQTKHLTLPGSLSEIT